MKYFTSDLHLSHPFVAALRGYTKPEHAHMTADQLREHARENRLKLADMVDWRRHDQTILDNINATVREDDELYVLGDLSAGGRASLTAALHTLEGLRVPRDRRHLILGNHEDLQGGYSQMRQLLGVFATVDTAGAAVIGGHNVLLSHFQFRHHFEQPTPDGLSTNACDPKYARYAFVDNLSSWLLHGHTHAENPFEFAHPHELNIGVDAWSMWPVSEEQVLWHLANAEQLIFFPPEPQSTLKRHR